jgi:hypothetical protein
MIDLKEEINEITEELLEEN